MTRLQQLPSRLGSVQPRLRPPPKATDPFYRSKEWTDLIASIKAERGNACRRCGSTNRVIGDHIKELKDGGAPLDPNNIELLCIGCHNRKTHKARSDRALGQT